MFPSVSWQSSLHTPALVLSKVVYLSLIFNCNDLKYEAPPNLK